MPFPLRALTSPSPKQPQGNCRRWHHEVLRARGETDALCERIAAAMTAAGYSRKDVFAVRLALEEAITNAIKHGHQGDARKKVRVSYCVDPEHTLAKVTDEGPGFDPRAVADPLEPENVERCSGRGLFLMRHYMTRVTFNDQGNCVSLYKRRTG